MQRAGDLLAGSGDRDLTLGLAELGGDEAGQPADQRVHHDRPRRRELVVAVAQRRVEVVDPEGELADEPGEPQAGAGEEAGDGPERHADAEHRRRGPGDAERLRVAAPDAVDLAVDPPVGEHERAGDGQLDAERGAGQEPSGIEAHEDARDQGPGQGDADGDGGGPRPLERRAAGVEGEDDGHPDPGDPAERGDAGEQAALERDLLDGLGLLERPAVGERPRRWFEQAWPWADGSSGTPPSTPGPTLGGDADRCDERAAGATLPAYLLVGRLGPTRLPDHRLTAAPRPPSKDRGAPRVPARHPGARRAARRCRRRHPRQAGFAAPRHPGHPRRPPTRTPPGRAWPTSAATSWSTPWSWRACSSSTTRSSSWPLWVVSVAGDLVAVHRRPRRRPRGAVHVQAAQLDRRPRGDAAVVARLRGVGARPQPRPPQVHLPPGHGLRVAPGHPERVRGHERLPEAAPQARVVVARRRRLLRPRDLVAQDDGGQAAGPLGQGHPPRPLDHLRLDRRDLRGAGGRPASPSTAPSPAPSGCRSRCS